jgi:uncharacterized protein YidB (DUF937 family)
MSLLGSVLGSLMGGQAQQSPVAGVVSSILGGGATGSAGGAGGGVAGLLNQFSQAGLGNVAQSWVSNETNHAVTPQQLQQVFGEQQVNQWAQQSNMQPHDLLSQLAHFLPQAVDGVTPQGQLPQGDIHGGMEGQDPFASPGVEVRRS